MVISGLKIRREHAEPATEVDLNHNTDSYESCSSDQADLLSPNQRDKIRIETTSTGMS